MDFSNIDEFKKNGKIGIVGGTGRMGQWALEIFKNKNYKNLFYNSNQKSEKLENQGIKFLSKKKMGKICDLIIISVPLTKTIKVINEIGPFVNKNAIFTDFSSIKDGPCKAMKKYSKKAIGMHPMFKETVKDLEGKNLIISPTNYEEQTQEVNFLKKIFGETKARIRVIPPKEHDKITSFNQSAIHLIFLVYGEMLKKYCRKNGISLRELEALDTPNSQMMNILLGRFLSTGNNDILWGIQNSTPESKEMRKILEEAVKKIKTTLDKKDILQFESDLESTRRKFKKSRMILDSEDSNKIVTLLKKYGTEKHYEDLYKEIKTLIKKEIKGKCGEIKEIENLDEKDKENYERIFVKMKELCQKVEKSFEKKEFNEIAKASNQLKKFITHTLFSGKRRMYLPIRKNHEKLEKIGESLEKIALKSREIYEIEKILPNA